MILDVRLSIFAVVWVCILACFSPLPAYAQKNPWMVIDAADGAILSGFRENDRWYPASLTKLMTAYVTMRAISSNEISQGSPVRISARANKMPASRMGYKIGTKLRVDTALKILIVKSANDVAVALAESVAGSVEQFAGRMNTIAKNLGMTASNFVNSNGLHNNNQYTSARDLALLSRRLLLDFPQYSHWFAIPAIKTSKKTHYSYNLLLERFSGANGMKTGFVCASGYNMVASAKRDGRQLIAVILGASSQSDRAILAARLLSKAFANPNNSLGNILPARPGALKPPQNMRQTLCTQQARKNRYEPGAGKAVIKSKFLHARLKTGHPLLVKPGGIDAQPGIYYIAKLATPQGRISIPIPRPNFTPKIPIGVLSQSANALRGTIPLPVKRPQF